MTTVIPEKAVRIPEAPEHFLLVEDTGATDSKVTFYFERDTGEYTVMELGWIAKPRISSWSMTTTELHVSFRLHEQVPYGKRFQERSLVALSAALRFIATIVKEADSQLDEARARAAEQLAEREKEHAERRAVYEAERKERVERARIEREEAAARTAHAFEAVKWMIDQKFKLRREGYKSTVFGTVRAVNERYISTVSEKNIPMTINLRELEEFYVKYEGDRKYTLIWDRDMFNNDKEKQEVKQDAG